MWIITSMNIAEIRTLCDHSIGGNCRVHLPAAIGVNNEGLILPKKKKN
jgi:hypothetical protein